MLKVFIDYDSVIHYEFIPEGETVNKELYLEVFKRLRDAIRRKQPEKWATNDWFLLHDNAISHLALIVKKYLARHSVTPQEHPPYSPDLAPADFYMFPGLKMKLKENRFVDSDEVIGNATKQLKNLSKNGFQECFEQLYERWKKCVDAGGKYTLFHSVTTTI
ncbi:Mariner Mos1 transposase [Araneus ventricosus]|uniref:Mariner Mos1 transposase n=1 Tax=Araneus ventricosus TaxID=182803 RepID=A0A4Y2MXC7_ARAVE|nr:Mariner Mos1 transposase [Araneus ventricosus]